MEQDFNMGGTNNMVDDTKNMGVFGSNTGFNDKPKGGMAGILSVISLVFALVAIAGVVYVVSTTNTSGLQKTIKDQKDKIETLEAKVASIETASKKNVSSEDKEQTSSNTTGQTTKTKLPFTEGSKALLEVAADYKKNKSNFIDQNGQFSVDIFTKTFKGKNSLKDTESLGNWNVTVTPKSEIAVELQPTSASSLNTKKIKYIVTVSNTELGIYAVTTDNSGKEERIKVEEDNSPTNVTTGSTDSTKPSGANSDSTSNGGSGTSGNGSSNTGTGNTTNNGSSSSSTANTAQKPAGGLDNAITNLNKPSNN